MLELLDLKGLCCRSASLILILQPGWCKPSVCYSTLHAFGARRMRALPLAPEVHFANFDSAAWLVQTIGLLQCTGFLGYIVGYMLGAILKS